MILISLSRLCDLAPLHPHFATLAQFLADHAPASLAPGRHMLQGDELFINSAEPTLVAREAQKLEVHRAYIDVHIPLSGEEIIGWKDLDALSGAPEAPFDEENDFQLFAEPAEEYITVRPGECFICFPADAHAPLIGKAGAAHRKLIVKIQR